MRAFLLIAMLGLAACVHTVMVVGRDGTQGAGTATVGVGSGTVELAMSGESYRGGWAAVSAGVNAAGTVLLKSSNGSRLRCAFEYGGWTDAGFGTCEDEGGRKYDLQIR